MARNRRNRRNRRNPVGALLLTNPRNRRNRKNRRNKTKSFKKILSRLRKLSRKGRKNRRNGLAMRTNRRNRKNGLALRTNRRNRRNGLALRTNRRYSRKNRKNRRNGSLSIGFLAPVTRMVEKLPGGKMIAQYGVPALTGGLALIPMYYVKKWVSPLVAQYVPAEVMTYVAPIGNTLTGAAVAATVQMLPIAKSTKNSIGLASLVVGGALDAMNYWQGSDADEDVAGVMGDGMAYDLRPVAGLAVDYSGVAMDYGDAAGADAMYAGLDFDSYEGQVILAGPRAWRRAFPMPRRTFRRGAAGTSRHAQRQGHRWGWLIKLVGFENMQKIAALPPAQRVATIKRLKEQAVNSLPQMIAAHSSEELLPEQVQTQGLAMDYGSILYAGGAF